MSIIGPSLCGVSAVPGAAGPGASPKLAPGVLAGLDPEPPHRATWPLESQELAEREAGPGSVRGAELTSRSPASHSPAGNNCNRPGSQVERTLGPFLSQQVLESVLTQTPSSCDATWAACYWPEFDTHCHHELVFVESLLCAQPRVRHRGTGSCLCRVCALGGGQCWGQVPQQLRSAGKEVGRPCLRGPLPATHLVFLLQGKTGGVEDSGHR